MGNDNKISMPSSTAGITQYFDDYETDITLQPLQMVFIILLIAGFIIALHAWGQAILGF
jgi:preprotein translocase subunit Sec61beta